MHYPNNSHAAHDARLLISFAIRVSRKLPTTVFKIVSCPDSPPRQPYRQPPCPMTDPVLRLVFMPCLTTTPLSSALSYGPVLRQLPVSVFVMLLCLVRALPPQASTDVLPAMDVTTPVAPRIRRFIPFIGNKNAG